jgi:putative peptide zinc metalloprotease protein
VVQDLAGCRNLYGDATAYLRSLLRRGTTDPSAAMPRRERRAVRAYAPVLAIGTVLCLFFAATVTVPITVALFARAVRAIGDGASTGTRLDGATTLSSGNGGS